MVAINLLMLLFLGEALWAEMKSRQGRKAKISKSISEGKVSISVIFFYTGRFSQNLED